MPIKLNEDCHVHSTFSDGINSIEENANAAKKAGILTLGCVDHVRKDTTWIRNFANAVKKASGHIQLFSGIEAKFLNQLGELDLPESDIALVDRIYAADHKFPLGNACKTPREIRELIKAGALDEKEAINIYFETLHNILEKYPRITFAHLFSIFPKIKILEHTIEQSTLDQLAKHCKDRNAIVEVDERWRCPGPKAIRTFIKFGVSVVASTDSHRASDIGHYNYVKELAEALEC